LHIEGGVLLESVPEFITSLAAKISLLVFSKLWKDFVIKFLYFSLIALSLSF